MSVTPGPSPAPSSVLEAPGAAVEAETWPPLRAERIGPWRAGLSGGLTRRANSAVLLGDADGSAEALDSVEGLYARNGLPPLLRVPTTRSPRPPATALVSAIDGRGYRTVATTRVLARVLDEEAAAPVGAWRIAVAALPDEAWLERWLGVKAAAGVDLGLARALLGGSRAAYLTAREGRESLAVIRAAPVAGWVALSCLAVAPGARRRGLGRALTLSAARWGLGRGARRVFLQVEVGNTAALTLYDDLGFREVDEYQYCER